MNGETEEKDTTAYLPMSLFGPTPPKAGATVTATVVSVEDGEVEVRFAGAAPEEPEEADTEGDIVEGIDKIPASTDNSYANM